MLILLINRKFRGNLEQFVRSIYKFGYWDFVETIVD